MIPRVGHSQSLPHVTCSILDSSSCKWASDKLVFVGSIPLYLEWHIPPGYPDAAPEPDLSNINNAPYAPAVKDQAIAQLKAEVSVCTCACAHCMQRSVWLSCLDSRLCYSMLGCGGKGCSTFQHGHVGREPAWGVYALQSSRVGQGAAA